MTLNNIIQTLKSAYQALAKTIVRIIKSPTTRNLIQTVYNFFKSLAKSLVNFIKSAKFKNWLTAARKYFLDMARAIKNILIRIIQSERLRRWLRFFRAKVGLLFEWIVKTTKHLFKRETIEKFVLKSKDYFSIIQRYIVGHKRLSAAIAILLVALLIWPKGIVPPESTTSLTPDPEKISATEKSSTINRIAPDFKKFAAGPPRKKAFFDYFSPLIEKYNKSIIDTRQDLLGWYQRAADLDANEKRQVKSLAAYYRLNKFDIENDADWRELLARVNVIPASLALAQAANESAWGTSRFAREANNYYGQWCFQKGCGLVPAKRDENKTHEVAAFKSAEKSVERYIHNLNSHSAYKSLRTIRRQLSRENKLITGLELAEGLLRYSERGEDYIEELQSMIKFNKLARFD